MATKLFDRVIGDLATGLKDRLSWLERSLGRSERLIKVVEGRRYYTPNIYVGKDNYEVLTPDSVKLGNYSFFVMGEPQTVEHPTQTEVRLTSPFSLIVWVDMRKVGLEGDDRNTEAIKEQVLMALTDIHIHKGFIEINRIYEHAENVFQDFTLDEVDNQYMMSPYAGFRFYGEMTTFNDCLL